MLFFSVLFLCTGLVSAIRQSAVSYFELWDATNNELIGTLQDGDQIPMREGGFNIKAVLSRRIGSLAFSHNGSPFHIEHYGPYFLCADRVGAPNTCKILVEGTHTVEAKSYFFSHARGPSGKANTVTFSIVPAAPVGGTELSNAPPKMIIVAPLKMPATEPTTTTTTTATGGAFQPIRINCGGPAYTDAANNVWAADMYFLGGDAYSSGQEEAIAGTTDDVLFQSERYGEFTYEIPVPAGEYKVILHFAEVFYKVAGARQFGLEVEDHVIPVEFDIVQEAGPSTAMQREIPVTVSDGGISIKTNLYIENPKISAIEVQQIGPVRAR